MKLHRVPSPLWVFGYGSLIWNPGFEPADRQAARLEGYRRRFCICSEHFRGTTAAPGLVLALDSQDGGSCDGVALRVAEGHEADALGQLRARELARPAYREVVVPLTLTDGCVIEAVTYVVNRDHRSYVLFSLEEQARIIATARGERGPNAEYLWNTARSLDRMGIADHELDALAETVRQLVTARTRRPEAATRHGGDLSQGPQSS